VSISSNGYVCFGNNSKCDSITRPSPYDILVGLNLDLDPKQDGSGQIYYKHLDSNSSDFVSSKIIVNLFDPDFEPENIFMITYDNVSPNPWEMSATSRTSFQIFLSSSCDSVIKKSFVSFKFTSCPNDFTLRASSGLTYRNSDGILKEVKIADGQQCTGSNVGQRTVWVSDLNNLRGKKVRFLFFSF
jgi:hypothetical protein